MFTASRAREGDHTKAILQRMLGDGWHDDEEEEEEDAQDQVREY